MRRRISRDLVVLGLMSCAVARAAEPGALRLQSVTIRAGEPVDAVPPELSAPPIEDGGVALVLFGSSSTPDQRRAAVVSAGGTWGAYVPDRGAMVLLPPGGSDVLGAREEVERIVGYAPAWKIAPSLRSVVSALDLRVSIHTWADVDAASARIAAAGGLLVDGGGTDLPGPTLRVRAEDAEAVRAIARIPDVRWIERATEAFLVNDRSRWIVQSNQPGVLPIHSHGLRGQGQILAGMDTGLDKSHCCFNTGRRIDAYQSYGRGDRQDQDGHGTHVFGTAGCTEPAGTFDGVAPDIHFVIQDIDGGGLLSPPSDLRDAFTDAYNKGARVHTNSWGSFGDSYSAPSQQIDDFIWYHQDFLILFAAGNWGGGANAGTLISEATAKNLVTVGGTVSYPNQDSLYSATSKGPTPGGRRKPEVTAPATGSPPVTSAQAGSACGFVGMSGTSMATPAAAASAVLVRQYFTSGYYPSRSANATDGFVPSAALVKAVLLAGADNMTADFTGPRPNNSQGWGRIHLDNALAFAGDPETLVVLDDRDVSTGFAATGQEHSYGIFVADPAQPVRVMLVWTDPAAAPGSVDALVNDLDLRVQLRGGLAYTGSAGFSGGWAEPVEGPADHLNNNEGVMIAAPRAGNATVRVRAFEINDTTGHPQDYALVVVGGVSPSTCQAAPASSPGASLALSRTPTAVRLSWDGSGADHAHVHRSDAPSGFGPNAPLLADFVLDQDPGEAGVQWDDAAALGDGGTHYYLVSGANACHDESP